MPRTAVNIVTYNSAATIGPCLDALLEQHADFAVTVIDNASTDDTVTIVRGYEPVTLHCNTENVGYAVAHNQGIAMTDSEFVLTLNPDVLLKPGFIAAMVTALESTPSAGMGAGLLLRVDNLTDETPTAIDGMGVYMRRNMRQGLCGDGWPVESAWKSSRQVFGADGAAAFYRRAMLKDIALDGNCFDPDFFIHKEDIDICFRAILCGWHGLYVPQARAHHVRHFRPGQRQRVMSDDLRRHAVRNRYYLMLKNLPAPLFWRYAPAIFAYDVLVAGYILLKERESLRAFAEVWQTREKMLAKRRQIQAARQIMLDDLHAWLSAGEPQQDNV
ncbi:MAG: glycosyltransferase family 2 protein [Chloroflexota bacterium]